MTVHPSFLDPELPQTEPIKGKTYRADGWAYFDFMRRPFPAHLFQELEAVAGEGNVVYIHKHEFPNGWMAALMMFSPEAYPKIIAYAKQEVDHAGERTVQ